MDEARPSASNEVAEDQEGFLTIVCSPYCKDIAEGDKSFGPSPLVHQPMPPGKHTITYVATDGSKHEEVVEIVAGKTTSLRVGESGASSSGISAASSAQLTGEAADRYAAVRSQLEPRVWSGTASVDEIKMLRAICRQQRDRACAEKCTAMLGEKKDSVDTSGAGPVEIPPPSHEDDPTKFQRRDAIRVLSTASIEAKSCGEKGGPTGTGRISVVFEPSGKVSEATTQEPFKDTAVGRCVESKFRDVSVPPFEGKSVTVHKSFVIEK